MQKRQENINERPLEISQRLPSSGQSLAHSVFRWISLTALAVVLVVPFQNFGPRPEDSIVQEEVRVEAKPTVPARSVTNFVPGYKYDELENHTGPVKLPAGYVPSSKMVYKSSSEDIPDEDWIKGMEKKFLLKFDKDAITEEDRKDQNAVNTPANAQVLKEGKSGKTNISSTKGESPVDPQPKEKITWQVIDREGKGKFRYTPGGPVRVEADYNVGNGEGVVRVLRPLSKQSQMSVEANSKDASETVNFHYSW